jgi:CRISPR/Cas system-associated exonuclease Cas4 (RecB family)
MSPLSTLSFRLVESSEAALRLEQAHAWLLNHGGRGAIVVGASRGAADDLARAVAKARGGALGLHRFSFTQLAAHLAAPVLASRGAVPVTRVGTEAVAARAAFEARHDGELSYFAPVASTPGFPRALARTLNELALARVEPAALRRLPLGGPDLAALFERFEAQFAAASATDRATLFEAAAQGAATFRGMPLLLLDIPLQSVVELSLARQLIEHADPALVLVPFGDLATLDHLKTLGVAPEVLEPTVSSDLTALRRNLFSRRQPPERQQTGEVRVFSAPGESRECVEITRRILQEARDGVRFDEIAVALRAPADYVGLLEDAFDRAGIPGWFERGARRPHPAGRAFLAILGCALERLSAIRFAEYLSLGQVPSEDEAARSAETSLPADDAVAGFAHVEPPPDESEGDEAAPPAADSDEQPVVAGALRAPWRWEKLIVDSAVIGGDPERWRRRLKGLRGEYEEQLREAQREDPDSARAGQLERDIANLSHLAGFALPIVDTLASWPRSATWGEWLALFRELAPRVLRRYRRVQRVLDELQPMAAIGPVTLEEARGILAERLRTLDEQPPANRYGCVFVGTPQQLRGRVFKTVFVPSLAERLFPQTPREDPMLLDGEMREPLGAGLFVQEDRLKDERLMLRLAVGAATSRLWLSYPRLDVSGARPRVPSFYMLDVMRAVTGRIPHHEALQLDAAVAGGARLDWPAPADPSQAIDDVEHDLATLRELVAADNRASVRGHAHYLLGLNDSLRRSVVRRWARAQSRWRQQDGLVVPTDAIRPMLSTQRLGARPYSVSALQKFTLCPYQFALSAIYRLQPNQEPEPLQRLDPLTKGSIFHEVQALFFRRMRDAGRLPVTAGASVSYALAVLEGVLEDVAANYEEKLAPAIPRVWRDEILAIRRDVRVWVRRLPEAAGWTPIKFEYSFGLSDEGRDESSVAEPVTVDGRFVLRGSVDVIESKDGANELRITDHKTGRNRTTARTVIGGGGTLQPVIYGLAVEKLLDTPVSGGRLFYCTAAGGFTEHPVPLTDANRRAGIEALEIIDRAIELGFLPPAPAERACTWCDFRPVCGPDEPLHLRRKPAETIADLTSLREMP